MTKSNRRGPKKMGRTRKARSRRYGGMQAADEVKPTDQATGQAAGGATGQAAGGAAGGAAFAAALNRIADGRAPPDVNDSQVILGNKTDLATEYGKIQGPYYTKFGLLAKGIQPDPTTGKRDPYSIVALLYLIKYHMVPDGEKGAIQTEFGQTVKKIEEMPESKSTEINQAVEAIASQPPFEVIKQGNTALLTYVNQILTALNA